MAELTKEEAKYIELALEPKYKNDKGQLAYAIATSWNYKKDFGSLEEWLTYEIFGDKTKTAELGQLKEKFKVAKKIWAGQKHRTGFANVEKFKQWVMVAKNCDGWGFVKADDKFDGLIAKYERGDFGFRSFKRFYEWYESTPKKCCYCGISEGDLKKLFKESNDESERNTKPLYSKKCGFTSALQVEKLNPNKPYNESNCKLACAFCNNAKSDMVNADNFKKFAKNHIKPLLDGFLGGISNKMPFFEKNNEKDDSRQYKTK